MLIACEVCHRQYDVGSLQQGAKVRCNCGQLCEVPEERILERERQRCGSCGGDLAQGAQSCGYCGSEVSISDRGYGSACPECYARLVKGASFCSSCGVPIRPQVIRKGSSSEKCPRCQGQLMVCEVEGSAFTECSGCGGVWLEEKTFERATTDQEHQSAVASYFATPRQGEERAQGSPSQRSPERETRYLACPVCGEFMNRKNFARCSGVIVDWCKGHGYWFDTHELEQILTFVGEGGLEKARKKEIQDQNHQVKLAKERARAASMAGGMHAGPMGPPGYRQSGYGLADLLGAVLRGFLG